MTEMAEEAGRKKKHKEWRKEVKKLRRKKIRQKIAEKRNSEAAKEESSRLKDPEYQAWLKNQEELEATVLEQEERQRQEQEELWMRRELLAKKKFREEQRKHEAAVAAKDAERLRIQKEFEQMQQQAQKRREERQRREEQAKEEHEQMLKRIADYIEFGGSVPEELASSVQSNPNKQLCPFFSKTNACRFGMHCCRNHIRPKLSRILFFPNLFSHIKLEQSKDTEYGCDINLECTESELNHDYEEFFDDVIEELKKYGEILNFRTCMNSQPHLRGNVLVEYSKERYALKAHMELQGRYYASRQINVEFSPIITWKSAICGLSYTNKCPKGRDCNFLHIFKNPGDVYNISVFKQENSKRKTNRWETREHSVMSWNDGDERSSNRNWRWSESPEVDLVRISKGETKTKESFSQKESNRGSSPRKRTSRDLNPNESSRSRSERSQSRQRKPTCRSSSRKGNSSYRSTHSRSRSRRSRSRRKEQKCSHSSSDLRQNGRSSSRQKETVRNSSKSPKPSKRHRKHKKRKHRSRS